MSRAGALTNGGGSPTPESATALAAAVEDVGNPIDGLSLEEEQNLIRALNFDLAADDDDDYAFGYVRPKPSKGLLSKYKLPVVRLGEAHRTTDNVNRKYTKKLQSGTPGGAGTPATNGRSDASSRPSRPEWNKFLQKPATSPTRRDITAVSETEKAQRRSWAQKRRRREDERRRAMEQKMAEMRKEAERKALEKRERAHKASLAKAQEYAARAKQVMRKITAVNTVAKAPHGVRAKVKSKRPPPPQPSPSPGATPHAPAGPAPRLDPIAKPPAAAGGGGGGPGRGRGGGGVGGPAGGALQRSTSMPGSGGGRVPAMPKRSVSLMPKQSRGAGSGGGVGFKGLGAGERGGGGGGGKRRDAHGHARAAKKKLAAVDAVAKGPRRTSGRGGGVLVDRSTSPIGTLAGPSDRPLVEGRPARAGVAAPKRESWRLICTLHILEELGS